MGAAWPRTTKTRKSSVYGWELTKEQKEHKQFVKKWLECINSIQNDKKTLLYKRGVSLKIYKL